MKPSEIIVEKYNKYLEKGEDRQHATLFAIMNYLDEEYERRKTENGKTE